jgi:hypothetical protein
LFSRKKDKFTAIKLYSIDDEQSKINRPILVERILEFFESELNGIPKEFDIHGPYGISKGQTIGIKAFKHKLEQKGHNEYYGLDGITESHSGFNILFNAPISNNFYTELIIWCNSALLDFDLKFCAGQLIEVFPISCGFEIEFGNQHQITSEDLTKKCWFGSQETQISYKHLEWIQNFSNGETRTNSKNSLLSKDQLDRLQLSGRNLKNIPMGNLYLVKGVI